MPRFAFSQHMSSVRSALGRCAYSTHTLLSATATSGQSAEGEQAVPQPHPGVPDKLQDF